MGVSPGGQAKDCCRPWAVSLVLLVTKVLAQPAWILPAFPAFSGVYTYPGYQWGVARLILKSALFPLIYPHVVFFHLFEKAQGMDLEGLSWSERWLGTVRTQQGCPSLRLSGPGAPLSVTYVCDPPLGLPPCVGHES